MRPLLIGVVVVAALAAGGVGAIRLHWLPLPGFLHRRATPSRPATVDVAVPQITTNLNGSASNFVQLTLTVGLAGPKVAKAFNAQMPAVENALIGDLRGMSLTELNGSGGMARLRLEVSASLDGVLGTQGAVRHVYFTQFVVQ